METFKIKKAQKVSYLICDSKEHGKDQILSLSLRYKKKGLFDAENAHRLELAKQAAILMKATNIRLVTVWYDAVCIPSGIINYKECRRTIKSFKLFS